VRSLQLPCVSIYRAYRGLNSLPARFQSVERALNLLGQTLELLHVGKQDFHFRALLRKRSSPLRDHCSSVRVQSLWIMRIRRRGGIGM
jgi:hypothetical protein